MNVKELNGAKREPSGGSGAAAPFAGMAVPLGLPRLFLWKRDLCGMLGVGLRTLERMISAGEVPAPDRRLRGRPTWLARTIYDWADRCNPGVGREAS